MVSLEFFTDKILPAVLWPWVWLILQQKWIPEIFSGGKVGRCVWLTTLPPSYADCLEIWDIKTPGKLRACPRLLWEFFTIFYPLESSSEIWGSHVSIRFTVFCDVMPCYLVDNHKLFSEIRFFHPLPKRVLFNQCK